MSHRLSRRSMGALLSVGLAASAAVFGGASASASTGALHASTITCGPKSASHYPAPPVGHRATYSVDSAGTVTVLHQSTLILKVTGVVDNSGWQDTVITQSGDRVHVGFQRIGNPNDQERFWARLNSTGTRVTVILQSCT